MKYTTSQLTIIRAFNLDEIEEKSYLDVNISVKLFRPALFCNLKLFKLTPVPLQVISTYSATQQPSQHSLSISVLASCTIWVVFSMILVSNVYRCRQSLISVAESWLPRTMRFSVTIYSTLVVIAPDRSDEGNVFNRVSLSFCQFVWVERLCTGPRTCSNLFN